ncbi:hypothetical protein HDU92_000531 [Lobulomyces angularis]|nr:hypothetical protein HDU92_000531 [Lobulomyces angularis]
MLGMANETRIKNINDIKEALNFISFQKSYFDTESALDALKKNQDDYLNSFFDLYSQFYRPELNEKEVDNFKNFLTDLIDSVKVPLIFYSAEGKLQY